MLLADSGKFGRFAKYRVLSLDELDTIITDTGLAEADADRIEAIGVDVIRAEVPADASVNAEP